MFRLQGVFAKIVGMFDSRAKRYASMPRYNIAVCGNISAGKSTLINALLGKDLLSVRNEATTAKITSVYDRDDMKTVFGCCVSNSPRARVSCRGDVNSECLADWNSDDDVRRIYLQSDLDGIGNDSKVVVVHDTPGTNNSEDSVHRKITMDFLKSERLDALLYVVNYENMLSNDQDVLLRDIRQLLESRQAFPVIFAVNKLDSADLSRDEPGKDIENFNQHVRKLGYSNFIIVPVAAQAGRLLKMALLGRAASFTENEHDDFDIVFRKFSKRMDMKRFFSASTPCHERNPRKGRRSSIVQVSGIRYRRDQLDVALSNTGLPVLECLINNLIARSNEERT